MIRRKANLQPGGGLLPTRGRLLVCTLVLVAWLAAPSPAEARAVLISSFPAANATLDRPPREVRLIFSEPIDPSTFTLVVVDAVGMHVDRANAHRFPGEPETLVVSLPSLDEGLYTVTYTVAAGGVTTGGTFHFALDFPPPHVLLVEPPDGAGFLGPDVTVRVETDNFDLDFWKHAWRLYLDGEEVMTTQQATYTLTGLEPGVHELHVVLVNPQGAELHETRSASHIAVGRPDPEAQEIARAAAGPGVPDLTLSGTQAIALAVAALFCLSAGVALGRRASG